MKKFVCILILTICWLVSNGQTRPVFSYNHPSKETLRSLALESSPKGYAYRTYLVQVLNSNLKDTTLYLKVSDIPFIFDNLFYEEVYDLTELGYGNSGYNSLTQKMDQSVGHKILCFAWVFRIGTFSQTLIKEDCGNILNCKASRAVVQKEVKTVFVQENPPKRIYLDDRPVRDQWKRIDPESEKEVEGPRLIVKEKQNWVVAAIISFVATSALATGTYFLLRPWNPGEPGIAPLTKDAPPVVTPPPTGGVPGIAPLTRVRVSF